MPRALVALALLTLTPAAARADDWTLTARIATGVTVGDEVTVPQWLVLGVGSWTTPRTYLGGLAGAGLVIGASDGGVSFGTRLGGEGRLVFAGGTGSARVNHGEWVDVPLRQWLGLAAGFETTDLGAENGGFATLEYGCDFVMNPDFAAGLVVSAGGGFAGTAYAEFLFSWSMAFGL